MNQQTRTWATLLTLMGLVAVRVPLAAALQALLPSAAIDPVTNYAAAMMQSVLMFLLPGLLLKPQWRGEKAERGFPLEGVLLALGAAVLARAVVSPLNAWWAGVTGAPAYQLPTPRGWPEGLAMLLAVVVVPAIAEEVFFRGALLTNLLQAGSRWQAAALTTAMFALMHGSIPGLQGHLVISLLLTLLMMHSGRLVMPILAHMAFNLLALVWPDTGRIVPGFAGVALLALMAWMMLRTPQGKARRLPAAEWLLCGAILAGMAAQYLI